MWVISLGAAAIVVLMLLLGLATRGSPASRTIPNAVGLTPAAAETLLAAKGFAAVVADQPTATGGTGLVVAEDPSAGVVLEAGGTITITVSVGP